MRPATPVIQSSAIDSYSSISSSQTSGQLYTSTSTVGSTPQVSFRQLAPSQAQRASLAFYKILRDMENEAGIGVDDEEDETILAPRITSPTGQTTILNIPNHHAELVRFLLTSEPQGPGF
jgi:hypothetical protein